MQHGYRQMLLRVNKHNLEKKESWGRSQKVELNEKE